MKVIKIIEFNNLLAHILITSLFFVLRIIFFNPKAPKASFLSIWPSFFVTPGLIFIDFISFLQEVSTNIVLFIPTPDQLRGQICPRNWSGVGIKRTILVDTSCKNEIKSIKMRPGVTKNEGQMDKNEALGALGLKKIIRNTKNKDVIKI